MPTLIYAPTIEVHIATATGSIIDVSPDITNATITRELGPSLSTLRFDLLNQNRKYDGLFTPMDRVVVYLRRLRRLLVFSGYLDSVPVFAAYAANVSLSASDTLKRLQQFQWDPNTAASKMLFSTPDTTSRGDLTDGGVALRTVELLNTVAGWPKAQIHIGAVPSAWFDAVAPVADKLVAEATAAAALAAVGSAAYIGGENGFTDGLDHIDAPAGIASELPARAGTVGKITGSRTFVLTGETPGNAKDQWFCAARWPYQGQEDGHTFSAPGVDPAASRAWWANRLVFVANPATAKCVVLRAVDWGPAPSTGRVMDLSDTALRAIGVADGGTINIAFAPPGAPVGPYNTPPGATVGTALSPNNAGTAGPAGSTKVTTTGDNTIALITSLAQPFLNGMQVTSTFRPGGSSYHARAQAVDFSNGTGNTPEMLAFDRAWASNYGSSLAELIHNAPGAICIKDGKVVDGTAFYGAATMAEHKNHVHVAISPASAAAGGLTLAGVDAGNSTPNASPTAGAGMDITGVAGALFNIWQWVGDQNFSADILTGIRALMINESILPTVDKYMAAALRQYCSAPNGDFIAWFPDYFGHYGTAAKLVIADIEIDRTFAVAWSDSYLKTHIFTTGSTTGLEGMGDASQVQHQIGTAGIASVEFPELMKALFNLPDGDALFANNGREFLNRYGARPEFIPMNNISGPRQEFFFACHHFMRNWAQQYSVNVTFSFMPELYPGMLAVFPRYSVQAYVESVSHTYDAASGFQTSAMLTGWSTLGDVPSIKGLPKGAPL